MKNLIILAFVSGLIFSGCNNAQTGQQNSISQVSGLTVENVDAAKFKSLSESGTGVILDVRTQDEVNGGFIKGASHIDIYDSEFERKVNMIPKNNPVYVYCKAGSRSSQAAEIMEKNGFTKVYNLQGGIMAWQANGFELVKPEGTAAAAPKQISKAEFDALLKTNQPVLVDFGATWCVPCKKMAPVVEKLKTDLAEKAVVVNIDIDNAADLVTQYKIEAVPTFILFKNGVNKWQHTGMISEEELRKIVSENY